MQVYRNEVERLMAARAVVRAGFPRFGVNKAREIVRLLYEISKRDNAAPARMLGPEPRPDFADLKAHLLRARFPNASRRETSAAFLPDLSLEPRTRVARGRNKFDPKRIVVEGAASNSCLERRLRNAFPRASVSEIPSLKGYLEARPPFGTDDYNRRCDTVFIVQAQYDFFRRCPCTKGAVACGYHVFNLGFGCVHECSYCYLQEYANAPGIVLPANIEHFFDRFTRYRSSPSAWAARRQGAHMRIGTGEFSDSLALDHITEYSMPIVDFFARHTDAIFEFKTKSARIDNLLGARHGGNVVLGWSLNPQKIIDENEWHTAPLSARLGAAARCAAAGYPIGLHFDPVFYFDGWEKEYAGAIEAVFDALRPEEIAWISVGTLRFRPQLKRVIENRFPDNTILDGELLPGFDRKLRYPRKIRLAVYKRMVEMLQKHSKKLSVYLCMEDGNMWREVGLDFPF